MASSSAPTYREHPLRVACVQYDPKLRDVQGNLNKASEMTDPLKPGQVDLVVFPEMAFTGYMFTSPESIEPFLEEPRIGPTALFCRSLAKRIGAYVIAGYPERSSVPGTNGWNSATVFSPSGDIVHNYRKSFLFDTDKFWAQEGDGFSFVDLPQPIGRLCLAICMDINPKDFLSPWDAYELSRYAQKHSVDTLVLTANWLDPPAPTDPPPTGSELEDKEEEDEKDSPDGPSFSTLNYWAHRLMPLHDPPPPPPGIFLEETSERDEREVLQKEVVFVCCNRVGLEEGTTFVDL
ncbi:Carbon-nitrogen hydrolase [Phaffia rhodozyma]|uniref:Carbon-nitrogen hydrolase n=1 Tax=Phaffia rhodozyma TaxID=264483 RepID=A0A0F7SLL9_PHARH|nr:Carbon-nitrogen hydrolase [Phaffia rhodozyma]